MQTDILLNKHFVPFINRAESIKKIDKIFAGKLTREWKKALGPLREIHVPWKEQTKEDQIRWVPVLEDWYTGSSGGSPTGPLAKMKQVARSAETLVAFFLFVYPLRYRKHYLRGANNTPTRIG